jgi:hypothetical protein
LITTNGKTHIKRYLAGFVPSICQSIAFGIGGGAEAVGSTRLDFEVGRSDLTLTSYDFVNNKLIFKTSVPDDYLGKIYEVALYSLPENVAAGEFQSRLLTTFDSPTEAWVDASTGTAGTFNGTFTRLGIDSLRHTPALSTTKVDTLTQVNMDLSGYSGADVFTVALNAGNTNTSSVKLLFLTDASNYYTVTLGAPVSGYQVMTAAKSTAVATGTPSWSNITEMRVSTTSGAGGASQIDYDGVRIEDTDTLNADYVLVSRELLASPYSKVDGMTQEIEFSLDINV